LIDPVNMAGHPDLSMTRHGHHANRLRPALCKTIDATYDMARGVFDMEDAEFEREAASPGGALHAETESLVQKHTQNPPQGAQVCSSLPVLLNAFVSRATTAFGAQSALTQELLAVAAGRSAYNLNVREAPERNSSLATAAEAMKLHKPSRPPIVAPEDSSS
jgi:hypothetical protein